MGQKNIQGTDYVDDALLTKTEDNFTELYDAIAAIAAGSGVIISLNDTVPGVLNGKLLVGPNFDLTENNDGGNETLTITLSSDPITVETLNSTHTAPRINLTNTTEEDTEGGRESIITAKGEQSGGEQSTLAEIEISHSGTSDDEKGKIIIKINDGNDGSSPTTFVTLTAVGCVFNSIPLSGITTINASGTITAGAFSGDGSALTNLPYTVARGCRVYDGSGTSIGAGTTAKIEYDTEDWDIAGEHTGGTFTPTQAGYYIVSAGYTDTAQAGLAELYLKKNSTTTMSKTFANYSIDPVLTDIFYMNGTTDTIEIHIRNSTGGSLTTATGQYVSYMEVMFLGT